jgi:hypothetical protein
MSNPFHKDLSGDELHVPGYIQSSDPGAVGSGKMWIDTSAGTGLWVIKIRNNSNTAWESISG